MVKDSDGRWCACRSPFFVVSFGFQKGRKMKNQPKKTVIAYRKTCQAKGTGLSHYILMNRKAK